MNNQYLKSYGINVFLFDNYMIESGNVNPDLIRAFGESNDLIEKAYQARQRRFPESGSPDIDALAGVRKKLPRNKNESLLKSGNTFLSALAWQQAYAFTRKGINILQQNFMVLVRMILQMINVGETILSPCVQ